jgi:dGTPase
MEVAQIGRGLRLMLGSRYPELEEWLPSLELLETISLAHDLGHPPFGHGGEIALNRMMIEASGFEGNGHTLRQLTRLEAHTPHFGLDLTRRTLLGVLKYPVLFSEVARRHWPSRQATEIPRTAWYPPKCLFDHESEILAWILAPLPPTDRERFRSFEAPTENQNGRSRHMALDTSIMELADDIAYGVHDLEDAITLHLITRDHWREVQDKCDTGWWGQEGIEQLATQLFDTSEHSSSHRKQAVGGLVHLLVRSAKLQPDEEFLTPLLAWRAELSSDAQTFLEALKELVTRHVILSSNVQTSTYRGHHIVTKLFEILWTEAALLLPAAFQQRYHQAEDETEARRVVCDYIAGMTDNYANRMYERLLEPGKGSVFDRL